MRLTNLSHRPGRRCDLLCQTWQSLHLKHWLECWIIALRFVNLTLHFWQTSGKLARRSLILRRAASLGESGFMMFSIQNKTTNVLRTHQPTRNYSLVSVGYWLSDHEINQICLGSRQINQLLFPNFLELSRAFVWLFLFRAIITNRIVDDLRNVVKSPVWPDCYINFSIFGQNKNNENMPKSIFFPKLGSQFFQIQLQNSCSRNGHKLFGILPKLAKFRQRSDASNKSSNLFQKLPKKSTK